MMPPTDGDEGENSAAKKKKKKKKKKGGKVTGFDIEEGIIIQPVKLSVLVNC